MTQRTHVGQRSIGILGVLVLVGGLFRRLPHPKIAILSIIGALNSATEWFAPEGSSSPEEIVDALADNALHGLLA